MLPRRKDEKHRESAKEDIFRAIGTPGIKGFLNLWILTMLNKRPMNGYEMLKHIAEATCHCWEPKTGSMYPALHGLQKKGLIKARKEGRRHQIAYALTPKGREIFKKIRSQVYELHRKHKFRRMLESIMWPHEPENVSKAVDELYSSIFSLRNSKISEKEKTGKLRRASSALR